MVDIEEISDEVEFERIGSHSHITGLGLNDEVEAVRTGDGLIGQQSARESAGRVVNLARNGKLAGRAVLFAGPPGTGKTALAVGMAKELGQDIPFVQLTGSEVFSADKDKNEILTEKLRRALGVRIQETREVYEGKVSDLDISQGQGGMNPYQQAPQEAMLTLETTDDTRTLRLGQAVAASLQQENITRGDVVRIDAETGKVNRLGKAKEDWEDTADVSVANLVPTPEGSIQTEREFTHTLTLHHLDQVNAKQAGRGLRSLFGGDAGVNDDIRNAVDEQVRDWIESGKGELLPGVLFIDEVHMLDIEAISFLNRAMEREFAPIMVLASNRGETTIRGTDLEAPHGLPLDMLDRLLIINTTPYEEDDIRDIVAIRAEEEDAELDESARDTLAEIGTDASLRYAVQLIAVANDIADDDTVTDEHVETARDLFSDVQRSSRFVDEHEDRMLS